MKKKILFPVCACIVGGLLISLAVFIIKAESTGEIQQAVNQSTSKPVVTQANIQSNETESVPQIIDTEKGGKDNVNLKSFFVGRSSAKVFNNELQAYLNSQTKFEGNKIILTAEKLPDKYISGKAESRKAFRYGKFHFKVNTLHGKGLFPAIWLMPSSGELYPEIDIFEMLGNYPYRVSGVMHYLDSDNAQKYFFEHDFPKDNVPESYDIKFTWTEDSLIWNINGKELLKVTENVPTIPMYIIFNLAIGGNWPGNPDKNTKFPTSLNIEVIEFKPEEIFLR